MENDLVSRSDLLNVKPEFLNEKIVCNTKYQTTKNRTYAKAWNACNDCWIDTIENALTVEAYPFEQVQELVKLNQQFAQEIENLKRLQGEWITRHKQNKLGQDVVCFECSRCGECRVPLYHLLITEPLKVCPNCGADMQKDGVE